MKIVILSVGKIKEKFYTSAINEYIKRLSKYVKLTEIEVADEKTGYNLSQKDMEIIKNLEGERIQKHIKNDGLLVVLDIKGKKLSSEEFASFFGANMTGGVSKIYFVIGGSLGLSEEIISRADFKLSFSDMTFPHQLMRVVLLEQIYRCFRIINNEPYHK